MTSTEQIIAILEDPRAMTLYLILTFWILIWKGFALWRASRNESKYWFIALLIINTMGLLEIIYIFYFSKKKKKEKKPELPQQSQPPQQ